MAMNNYRTLTAVAALALSAFAANAQSNNGEAGIYTSIQDTPSTLTREAVVAELVRARQNGTLPQGGEWIAFEAPSAISGQSTVLTRSEARTEGAIAAAGANETTIGSN